MFPILYGGCFVVSLLIALGGHLDNEGNRKGNGVREGKDKLAYAPKPKIPPPPKRDTRNWKSICHHYKRLVTGRRNVCPTIQSAYPEKILKKFRMENSKKRYTSMMENPDYRKSQGAKTPTEVQRMWRVPYTSAIGSIIEIHWTAMKTILKYLRNTKDMVLMYGAKPEDELKVSCYADVSFQTDKDDTISQTRYVFVLNGRSMDWKSAKKSNTAMSSTQVEYIAVVEASMEAVWMRKFIDGLRDVMSSNKRPMEMLCDNETALAIASDPRILKGARHFQSK
ncbi:hypothetical protein Tco_1291726 [Tanacetum coccineum]